MHWGCPVVGWKQNGSSISFVQGNESKNWMSIQDRNTIQQHPETNYACFTR
uniref:Uncharacterized protein LOC105640342 n=1 Tax=Rhizophora mucronata TaxID=61149 RepID=A0A2P2JT70_RHIMU